MVHPAVLRRVVEGGVRRVAGGGQPAQVEEVEQRVQRENASPVAGAAPNREATPELPSDIVDMLTGGSVPPKDWQSFKWWVTLTVPDSGSTTRTKQQSLDRGPEASTTDTVTAGVIVGGYEPGLLSAIVPSSQALIITRLFIEPIPRYGTPGAFRFPYYGAGTSNLDIRWLAMHLYTGILEVETLPAWLFAPDNPAMGGINATSTSGANTIPLGGPSMDPWMLRFPKLVKPRESIKIDLEAGGDASGYQSFRNIHASNLGGLKFGIEGVRLMNFNLSGLENTEAKLAERIPGLVSSERMTQFRRSFQNLAYTGMYRATIGTGKTTLASFSVPANEGWFVDRVGIFVPRPTQSGVDSTQTYPPGVTTTSAGANRLYLTAKVSGAPILDSMPTPNIPLIRNGWNLYYRDLAAPKLLNPLDPVVIEVENLSGAAIVRPAVGAVGYPEAIGQAGESNGVGGFLFYLGGKKYVNYGGGQR